MHSSFPCCFCSKQSPEPKPIHPLFPDLAVGNCGLKRMCSTAQSGVNAVMAALFNRLAANALIGVHSSPALPEQPFTVEVDVPCSEGPGSVRQSPVSFTLHVSSVEGLIDALVRAGHAVDIYITSNITSFGLGLCIDDSKIRGGGDETRGITPSWTQVPVAYPLSTGLYALDEQGNEIDVVTLMVHSAVHVDIKGPAVNCHIEWCLSIEGQSKNKHMHPLSIYPVLILTVELRYIYHAGVWEQLSCEFVMRSCRDNGVVADQWNRPSLAD